MTTKAKMRQLLWAARRPMALAAGLTLILGMVTLQAPLPLSAQTVGAVQVGVGGSHACAVLDNGTAKCWGLNHRGQLGNGTTTDSPTPVPVLGLTGVVEITASGLHTCARLIGGDVLCWGDNFFGQLGNGVDLYQSNTNSSTPVLVQGLRRPAIKIAAGRPFQFTCALLDDGTVQCWGRNYNGQLGNGTQTDSSTPVDVQDLLLPATDILAALTAACARLIDDSVKCWGAFEQNAGLTAVPVLGLPPAKALATGQGIYCGLTEAGEAWCWGDNDGGAFGDGTTIDHPLPQLMGFSQAVQELEGGQDHTCALLVDGTVECGGYNGFGALGIGAPPDGSTLYTLTPVPGLHAVDIGAASRTTCAVLANGTVQCWGDNRSGQLGDGTTTSSNIPVTVIGLANPPTLDSIEVTMTGPTTVSVGNTVQLEATGHYSDGTTSTLTGSVLWNSNSVAVSVALGGLATAEHVGTANISATFDGVTSPPVTLTVTPANTEIGVSGSPNPSYLGEPAVFDASVTTTPSSAIVPTGGMVTFTLTQGNRTTTNTAPVNAGHALFSTSALNLGSYAVRATYGGITDFNGSTTPTAWTQTVTKWVTSTILVIVTQVNQAVTLKATVVPARGSAPLPPTGHVNFFDGSKKFGSASLASDGTATISATKLKVGTYTITAVYAGDKTFFGSTSNAVTFTLP